MTKKIKLLFKKVIITIMLILTLFSALFSGFAYGAESDVFVTQERAGNYVSSFAINFFKNWSSVNYVYTEGGGAYHSSGVAENVLAAGQEIYDNILLGDTRIQYIAYSGRDAEKICTDKQYSEEHGMDCSTFVSAALWLAGYKEEFARTKNTYNLEDGCLDGSYIRNYGFEVYKTDRSGKVYKMDENGGAQELQGVSQVDILQPGDVIVVNKPDRSNGHTNIVKEVRPNNTNKYLALDCGNANNWQNTSNYNANGGGSNWDIWTSVNWDGYYGGTNQAFLIRATNGTSSSNSGNAGSSKQVIKSYGEIKTEYDSTRDERSTPVDPEDETYKFSNKSFIDFAFKNSLGLQSDRFYPISNYSSTSEYFTEIGTDKLTDEGLIDINQMINSGQLLPGDILYTSYGLSGTQGDYLLYVGGSKVIYATRPIKDEGALKYEYMQNYLARVKNSLTKTILQAQPNLDTKEIKNNLPAYGVKKVYRLSNELVRDANIVESNTNLFFNGKGYYDPNTKYDGIPTSGAYRGRHKKYDIIGSLKDVFWFLVSGITFLFRAFAVGCIAMVDFMIQFVVSQLSGTVSNAPIVEPSSGVSAFSYTSSKISIESIFFNGIPILDANFFNFETAAGHDITAIDENGKPTMIYVLKRNIALWYVIIRSFSIGLMLFMLLYAGIKMAIATTAEKKADSKKMLFNWAQGLAIVIFIHFFMYAVIYINDSFVKLLYEMMTSVVNSTMNGKVDELSFYEMVRTKAYVFDFRESLAGIILYVIVIYYLIRFLLIYFKRLLSIYVLGMLGSFIGVKHAWDKANGKKRTSIEFWMKDFAFNVLLQSIHCLIYVLFMTVAFETAMTGMTGIIFSLVILRFMIDADKIFMKVFGIANKGGLFEDVNKPEKYVELFGQVGMVAVATKSIAGGAYNAVAGKNGIGRQVLMGVLAKPDDDLKKAQKKVDLFKYKLIGKAANKIERDLPILLMAQRKIDFLKLFSDAERHRMYKLLSANISDETRIQIYGNIHKKHDLIKQQYTRPLNRARNLVKSTYGILATPAMIVSGDSGWAIATGSAVKSIRGFRKEFDMQSAKRYRRNMEGFYTPGVVGSMAIKEKRTLDKFNKDIKKIEGKDYDIEHIAKYEDSILQSIEKLKENKSEQELAQLINEYQRIITRSSKTNISASKIQRAVSTYMVENKLKKLNDSDLKNIMEKLQIVLDEKKSNKIKVSTGDTTKDDQFIKKLKASFGPEKIDGMDSKKASALLAEALNLPGMVGNRFVTSTTGDDDKELKNIYNNLKRIYSLNQRSKVENKGEAVSFGSMKKEFHKKMTEVKK